MYVLVNCLKFKFNFENFRFRICLGMFNILLRIFYNYIKIKVIYLFYSFNGCCLFYILGFLKESWKINVERKEREKGIS